MKTSLKAAISIFILGTLYFVFSGVSATCTLTLDNYQCNEDESCSLSTGCLCFGNAIAFNDLCNGASISVDNSGVPATAFSGSLITFKFTVTSYTGDKYFMLRLPLNTDYGIEYLNSSITPDNNFNLSLGIENDPIFTVHAGETKTFVITGNVVAQYRAILPMSATGNVYKDPLYQQLSVKALSSLINPAPYITIAKSLSGIAPRFSGDAMNYTVTLQNIGSLGEVDLSFLERFPLSYLYAPVISFDGTIQNYSAFISPNLYVYSGTYLVLNPGQIINIFVTSFLKNNFAPASFTNTAGFGTGGSVISVDTAIATGFIQAYLDILASTITTGSVAPQMSGDSFAFTFDYGQLGNMTATGMTMKLTITGTNISGAVYNLSDLTAGATGAITVTGTLNANYIVGTQVCANAYFASPTETASTGNNSIIGCYTVAPIADVMVTKQISPSINLENLISGSQISYVITVTNTGTKIATGITLTDVLPSQISYVSNSLGVPTIVGNQLTWNLPDINPGAHAGIVLTGTINNYPNAGMDVINTGIVATASRESLSSNNQFILTTHLSGISDVYITKTLAPISGFKVGTPVVYTINYGNAGGKTASGVVITDTFPSTLLTTPTTSWTIGNLTPGQTGRIILTGTMINGLSAGQAIENSAHIATNTVQLSTANDDSTVTGTVPTIDGAYVDMIANNITRPQLDTPPYGTNSGTMIQAVSGDVIRFTISYGNAGNIVANNATLSLGGLGGIVSIQNTSVSLGTLNLDATGMIIMTGIVGPKNFITFSPTATLNYNINQFKTDTLTVNEPFSCGDGLVTRTEECDTNGPVGNIALGQECENQQGACVLVTRFIINSACISFDYNNPQTGFGTGSSCSSVAMPLTQASCSSLVVGASTPTTSGTNVAMTCNGANASNSTRIAINCGNGSILSGFGTSLAGTCTYAAGFNGNASCLVGGETTVASGCSQAVGVNAGQCTVLPLDGDMIILDGNGNGSMPVVCEASDGSELTNATVDCGNGIHSVDGVCTYNNVYSIPSQRTITCTAPGGVSCSKDLIADQGFLADCGNNKREGYEQCDGQLPAGYDPANYYCSNNCTIERSNNTVQPYYPPACFSVNNGNLSVQEGEYMPFWRRLDQKKLTSDTTCSDSDEGKVIKNSLKCTFKIYNGTHQEKDGTPAFTLPNQPCYDTNSRRNSNLFDYFNDISSGAYGKYSIPMLSGWMDNTYGEYKLVLDSVNYDYCDANGNLKLGEQVNRVCEVNFAVTKPYLAQKSAFGLTPKAVNDIDLDDYWTIDGIKLIKDTQLDQIMTVDANDYKATTKIDNMVDTFVAKYEKLAIKMNISDKPAGVATIKKVPNQSIFIFEGNGTNITIGGKFSDVPFTVIARNTNLVISGNININGMFLVPDGNIIFNNGNLCDTKNQEVQGIFVTNKSFASIPPLENIPGRSRCNFGGLYVKGVLIGDGIDTLVKARRSQLNSRFSLKPGDKNAQRRNKIFNGAAVLIEYSPSLRNALPPGANEFTKALEVYKK